MKPTVYFLSAAMSTLVYCAPAQAEVKLNPLFSDGAVLQQDAAIPVWGTARDGESVTVQFDGQEASTSASGGKWMVRLQPHKSGGPFVLTVKGDNKLKIDNVLVGEVWVCSGQSNMGSPLNSAHNAAEVLPKAEDSQLRFYKVSMKTSAEPLTEVSGKWEASTPAAAKNFSAVAYFFARELRESRKCPVGVVQSAWGGTSIECWTSLGGLKKDPPLQKNIDQWNKALEQYAKVRENPQLVADYVKDLKQWQTEVAPAFNAAMKAYNEAKAAGNASDKKPQPARPEPVNPDPMAIPSPSKRPGTPTVIYNAMIEPLAPYAIRGYVWYQGENNAGAGLEYRAQLPRLIEDWRTLWKRGDASASGELPFIFVQLPSCGIDTVPVADKGWPWLREAQLMALKVPGSGMAVTIDVGDPKNVHPADKVDVGQRLALVARKLAYGESVVASGPLYKNFTVEDGGKLRVNFTETGGGLTIGQSPWYAPGVEPFPKDKLIGFYIAGEDKKWSEAEARIDGNSVIVSSPDVPKPAAVRYGWAASPRCNWYNKEGLPASPFRTDVE